MFTSGTTGLPKGAMLIHRAICKGYDAWCEVVGMRAGRPLPHHQPVLPFVRVQLGRARVPHAGRHQLAPRGVRRPGGDAPRARSTASRCCRARRRSTRRSSTIPTSTSSTCRRCACRVTGAAAIPVEMIYQMRERLGFETIVTGYGLTETSGIVTMCRHDDDPETIARTSGRAIPDIEVRVVDDDNNEVPRGEPGEIVVRGYVVMKGYLDDPRTDRRDDRPRRLVAYRRHRGDGRAGLRADHRPQEGHVHRRRLQRVPRRDREPHVARIRRSVASPSSVCPTHAWAKSAWRSSSRGRTPSPTRPRSSRGAVNRWPTTRCRATSNWSTHSPSIRAARCSSTSCANAGSRSWPRPRTAQALAEHGCGEGAHLARDVWTSRGVQDLGRARRDGRLGFGPDLGGRADPSGGRERGTGRVELRTVAAASHR